MKTIYINEQAAKIIEESVLKNALPDDICAAIESNKTSLGNNPAIPDIFDVPYLLKISQDGFENSKSVLKELGSIDDVEGNTVGEVYSQLVKKCIEIERPVRNELERICFNYVIDLFEIPQETVKLKVELCDNVNADLDCISVDPFDGEGNIELNDINDAMSIRSEVYKRRLLDMLSMGCGINVANKVSFYAEEISKISPELPELYKKIMKLAAYLVFEKEDMGITDENKKQVGVVSVTMGDRNEQVSIEAQGIIFPILLCETIRGFMELFASHGLPSNKDRAQMIIQKADYLKAEPWDMRLGPILWEIVSKSFNDVTFDQIPYLYKRLSSLDVEKFNFLMKEVLAKTKKGKHIMSNLCAKSKRDSEYDKFVDKMDKMKIDKSIIVDEFLGEEDLHGTEDNRVHVWIMIGIPGSGKSTWIKNNLPGVNVVSRDIIRAKLGYCKEGEKVLCTYEQEMEVTRVEREMMERFCDEGKDFVIDDTNTNGFLRDDLLKFLRSKNVKLSAVELTTPLNVCIDRRDGQIDADVMKKIHSYASSPNKDDYDEYITIEENKVRALFESRFRKH